MSILTASNPLILALVLSLYHVSKESYRILKLKKILICSTIGGFTLQLRKILCSRSFQKVEPKKATALTNHKTKTKKALAPAPSKRQDKKALTLAPLKMENQKSSGSGSPKKAKQKKVGLDIPGTDKLMILLFKLLASSILVEFESIIRTESGIERIGNAVPQGSVPYHSSIAL